MKPSVHTGWPRWVRAFLSGMLLAQAFPNFNLYWLAWLAPGLMLWTTRSASGKAVLGGGYLAGLGNYSVLLGWLLLIPIRSDAVKAHLAVSAALSFFIMAWCWVCWWLCPRAGSGSGESWAVGAKRALWVHKGTAGWSCGVICGNYRTQHLFNTFADGASVDSWHATAAGSEHLKREVEKFETVFR